MIALTLPIYRTRNKKGDLMLLGLNQIMCLRNHFKNKIKSDYQKMVAGFLEGKDIEGIEGQYKATFTLYYPHRRMDLPNVCSIIDKYVMDAMVESGYLKNDNVNNYVESLYIVGGLDKENPRVEVIIENI